MAAEAMRLFMKFNNSVVFRRVAKQMFLFCFVTT